MQMMVSKAQKIPNKYMHTQLETNEEHSFIQKIVHKYTMTSNMYALISLSGGVVVVVSAYANGINRVHVYLCTVMIAKILKVLWIESTLIPQREKERERRSWGWVEER